MTPKRRAREKLAGKKGGVAETPTSDYKCRRTAKLFAVLNLLTGITRSSAMKESAPGRSPRLFPRPCQSLATD